MKQKIKEKIIERPQTGGCHHFWVIEVANGPTSRGSCKYCGEAKEFYNAFPDFNPLRRGTNPLELPKMNKVEVDQESKS
jgi:hypothetical protein